MKSPFVFKEYIWLVNTIYRARRITLEEISRKWQQTDMSEGLPMARSSFNRHKDAIEEIFGICIECDRSDRFKYYISNAEVLEEDTIQNWMLSTLTVNNTISESRCLYNRILLESIPSEGENLHAVIDAMKQNRLVEVVYKKYSSSAPKEYLLEPYCVKLFRRRWYLLGKKVGTDDFRTLSFDRMERIGMADDKFKLDKEFEADRYFKDCFGIVSNDGTELQKVLLRAFGTERFSMRDLPIHHSQKEVATKDEFSDFEFELRPTLDFSGYLVSRGALVKVLEPRWLADEICKMHEEAMKLYTDS